jgi:preprotein translocase subunit SecG
MQTKLKLKTGDTVVVITGNHKGASGAITGAGMNVFVKTKERGSELIISWLTLGFAVVFFLLALLTNALA